MAQRCLIEYLCNVLATKLNSLAVSVGACAPSTKSIQILLCSSPDVSWENLLCLREVQ